MSDETNKEETEFAQLLEELRRILAQLRQNTGQLRQVVNAVMTLTQGLRKSDAAHAERAEAIAKRILGEFASAMDTVHAGLIGRSSGTSGKLPALPDLDDDVPTRAGNAETATLVEAERKIATPPPPTPVIRVEAPLAVAVKTDSDEAARELAAPQPSSGASVSIYIPAQRLKIRWKTVQAWGKRQLEKKYVRFVVAALLGTAPWLAKWVADHEDAIKKLFLEGK